MKDSVKRILDLYVSQAVNQSDRDNRLEDKTCIWNTCIRDIDEDGDINVVNAIHDVGMRLRRSKQSFIERMRILAAMLEADESLCLDLTDFSFPDRHVNVDIKEERVRFIEDLLISDNAVKSLNDVDDGRDYYSTVFNAIPGMHDEQNNQERLTVYLSYVLFTSQDTIRDDLALVRRRQDAVRKRNISVLSTEVKLSGSLNMSELYALLHLVEEDWKTKPDEKSLRAAAVMWQHCSDYQKNQLHQFLSAEFLTMLESVDSGSALERSYPLEKDTLFTDWTRDTEGWLVPPSHTELSPEARDETLRAALIYLEKSGIKDKYCLEVRLKNQIDQNKPSGQLREVRGLQFQIQPKDPDERPARIRIPDISTIRVKKIKM